MKKIKPLLLFSFFLMVSSCATNYEQEKAVLLSNNESTDLVNSFDVNKEQAEIFKTTDGLVSASSTAAVVPETPTKKGKGKKTKEKVLKVTEKPAAISTAPVAAAEAPAASAYTEEFKGYDQKSKKVWDKFKPAFYQGEQSIMAITYLGVTAGHITILSQGMVTLKNKQAYHYFARFKSSDSYRYFYWLDDKIETFIEKGTFLPMKYSLIQREKKQNVDDLQLFDFNKLMTYHWYKRVKENSNKDEKVETPIPHYVQDSFSALQFVRGMPLLKGDIYEFPIGTEPERKLLKFQAKIKIGSVFGELVEYRPGTLVK